MKVVGLAVALVAVLVVMSCFAPNSGAQAQSTSWEFLLLVQQWGPGVCATSRGKQCVIPSYVQYWTLHGMWPNNFDGSYPTNCPDSESFNMQRLEPIRKSLTAYWPTLFTSNSLQSFWEHEFEKHGTCAASDPTLSTELAYFNATLTARATFDLSVAFSKAGISPSTDKTYSIDAISQAVQSAYGGVPLVQCSSEGSHHHHRSGKEALTSIGLCLTPSLTIIDCPSNIIQKEGCHSYDNGVVFLPFN
jgi:ribonuclease T2